MTNHPDPREDALAKAREAIKALIPANENLAEHTGSKRAYEALRLAKIALAALSAPLSQPDPDDEKLVEEMAFRLWEYQCCGGEADNEGQLAYRKRFWDNAKDEEFVTPTMKDEFRHAVRPLLAVARKALTPSQSGGDIEAVARAISDVERQFKYTHSWENSDDDWKDLCRLRANAAIAALTPLQSGADEGVREAAARLCDNARKDQRDHNDLAAAIRALPIAALTPSQSGREALLREIEDLKRGREEVAQYVTAREVKHLEEMDALKAAGEDLAQMLVQRDKEADAALAALTPSQSGAEAMREAAARKLRDIAERYGDSNVRVSLLNASTELRALPLPALTPSPTDYVRSAAEIRAKIEWSKEATDREFYEIYRAALSWTLTPPTTETKL